MIKPKYSSGNKNILVLDELSDDDYKRIKSNMGRDVSLYAVSDKLPEGYVWEFYNDGYEDGVRLLHTSDKNQFQTTVGSNIPNIDFKDWKEVSHRGYDEFGNFFQDDSVLDDKAYKIAYDANSYLDYAKKYSDVLSSRLNKEHDKSKERFEQANAEFGCEGIDNTKSNEDDNQFE